MASLELKESREREARKEMLDPLDLKDPLERPVQL